MPQTDMNVANAPGAAVRADLNAHIDALVTVSSGATEPTTKFAFMWWADTATGLMKQRNSANTNWITLFTLADGPGDLRSANDLSDVANAATARANLAAEAADAAILKSDVTATLAIGFDATENNAGTKTTGTFIPDPANGNFQKAVNGGAHTLAPPAKSCSIVIQYTNDASAGTVTTSGFTLVDGNTISTTDADDFHFFITEINGFSHLHVKALQ